MGRKRSEHNVQATISEESAARTLDLREANGLYPFSPVWRWRPQSGKQEGELVSLTIDTQSAKPQELRQLKNNPYGLFFSEFKTDFPWAVTALGQGLKTICLESCCSHAEASYKRNAIGVFFEFCRRKNIALKSYDDLSLGVMCEWRADLRLVEMDSRYKAAMFRRCCFVIKRIMGTELMPVTFSMPVYSSDTPEPLAPYSDAVMYQLIGAVTSDIESLMNNAKEFSEIREHPKRQSIEKLQNSYSRQVVDAYCNELSFRSGNVRVRSLQSVGEMLSRQATGWGNSELKDFEKSFHYVCPEPKSPVTEHLRRLTEREVPSKRSLFPFLAFFLMFSGKNKEVVLTWKRRYKVKGYCISPLEWKDPFDSRRCRLRGYKGRGKGRSNIEVDDTYVTMSDEGIYPVLKFFLWYSEPLSALVNPKSKDSLWLYFRKNGAFDFNSEGVFSYEAKKFLRRHEIWDLSTDGGGGLKKERILTLDSRRFRKVYATRELLKAIGEASNHQELHAALSNSLNHKSFDTTLSSYLSLGSTRSITDIAIFTLQQKYLEEARKFRGIMVNKKEQIRSPDVPGFYAACADPREPDYEGAPIDSRSNCQEYDMCLGCKQSRVFEQHLPRIATRILQYESLQATLPEDRWEIEYGRKHARAHDLLSNWSDKEMVSKAWEDAKRGAILLPSIIARG